MKKMKIVNMIAVALLATTPIISTEIGNINQSNIVQAAKKTKYKVLVGNAEIFNKKGKMIRKSVTKGTKVKNLGNTKIKGAWYTKIGKNQYVENMYFSKKYAAILKQEDAKMKKYEKIRSFAASDENPTPAVKNPGRPGFYETPLILVATKKTKLYRENSKDKFKKYKILKAGSKIRIPDMSDTALADSMYPKYTKKGTVKKIVHSKFYLEFLDLYGEFTNKKNISYRIDIDAVKIA